MFEGKALYIDYAALANIAIEAGFTRSNGEAELHATEKIFEDWGGSTYFAWFFQAMNPWIHRYL